MRRFLAFLSTLILSSQFVGGVQIEGAQVDGAQVDGAQVDGASPNIVLIVADDLGYAELGCYGQKIIETPNIDRIASEGIRFTDFYSGNAVCAPSRCCLMTGKHPGHAFVRNNGNPDYLDDLKEANGWEFPGQHPIPAEEVTVAELLQQKGYATAAIGKWGLGHFGTTGDPNRQGFDLFYGFNCQRHAHNHYPQFLWRNHVKEQLPGNDRTLHGETYSQDEFTEVALEFIRENKDRPFFLYLPFAIPHLSIQIPESSLKQYKGKVAEEPYTHRSNYQRHPFPRAGYAAMVSHMDRDVGKIRALITELGLAENTLVIFSSDNGPTFNRLGGSDSTFFESAGEFRGLKGSLYEGGIRVPMLASWPGKITPNQVTDHVSAFWDILPTLCEVAKIDAPTDIDGKSFLPTLLDHGKQEKHPYLYWEFAAYGGQQAVRMNRWKGIRQNMLIAKNPAPLKIELYDLSDDPSESKDLSEEFPEITSRIEQIMAGQHVPSERFTFKTIDPASR